MIAAIVWLILGLVLVAAEALSGDFVLLMLGVGALGAAGAQAIWDDVLISGIVFAVLSIALVAGVRPIVRRKLAPPHATATNTQALLGRKATAITEITKHDGRVKIGGDVWSARPMVEDEVIEAGTDVTVVEISGATAVVTPKP